MKKKCIFHLENIRNSLEIVQKNFAGINKLLSTEREAFTDEVKVNLLEAYRFTNEMLMDGKNLFEKKNYKDILELNHIVLCGVDPHKRVLHNRYLEEAKNRFYLSIDAIQSWYKKHESSSPEKRASEVYVGILSSPQLFSEGNHRTGSILASWILLQHCKPPFVLNIRNAVAYFEPSAHMKFTDKREIKGKWKLPKYKKKFKQFLVEFTEPMYMEST